MKLNEIIDNLKLDYHDFLNPKLWKKDDGHFYILKDDVKQALLKITNLFVQTLKLPQVAIKDFILTGSNANYNWTKLSDVDIHILVDYSQLDCDDCKVDVEDCLFSKKTLWNDRHDLTIYGQPVELYASDSMETLVKSAGIYSLITATWIQKPLKEPISYDDNQVKVKANELAHEIDKLISSKTTDQDAIEDLKDRLQKYRASGIEKAGEFSIENLVWKSLRNNGYIDKLRKYSITKQDKDLSLESKLFEIFNSTINYKILTNNNKSFKASFDINLREINTTFDYDEGEDCWYFEFYEVNKNKNNMNNRTFKATNSGGEFQVFSAIKNILLEFIERYYPNKIKFSGEANRVNLYEKMIKNLHLQKYKISKRVKPSGGAEFTLTLKD